MIRERLGDRAFWKPAVRLAVPVALQNLLLSSAGLIDTLMVGQLGDVPVAAVGMATQWSWLMHLFFYGISSGAAVFLSQYWGAKDEGGIRRAYGLLTVIMLLISSVMFAAAFFIPTGVIRIFSNDTTAIETGAVYLRYVCFSYLALALSQVFSTVLRSTEQVRIPLAGSVVGVLANLTLNYGLIFGRLGLPQMGVAGAALATSIAAWLGMITVFAISFTKRNLIICPPKKLFRFDRAFIAHFIRVSLPSLANEALWSLGVMGYNMVYGRIGTAQFAAITIFRTIDGLFFSLYVGICHACGVLVGREIGAGRVRQAVLYADRFTIAMPLLSLIMCGAMIALRGPIVGLFDVSAEVAGLAMGIMLLHAINIPIRNIPYITICGIFRPGGDTQTGLVYDLLTVWCLALPLTVLTGLVLHLDFLLVYALMLVAEDWPKTFLCLKRLRSRAWIQPVVLPKPDDPLPI